MGMWNFISKMNFTDSRLDLQAFLAGGLERDKQRGAQHTVRATESISSESFAHDEKARLTALEQARALCRRLETPWDSLVREIWVTVSVGPVEFEGCILSKAKPSVATALKISIDSGMLASLSETEAKSSVDVATTSRCEPGLARRILRILASSEYIEETEDGLFRGTSKSRMFCQPGYHGGMVHLFDIILPTFSRLPAFFTANGYKEPDDPADGPWQFQSGSKLSHFEWVMQRPDQAEAFNNLMAVYHEQTSQSWTNVYDPKKLMSVSIKPDLPLVVDMGGGIGKDMENLRQTLLPSEYLLLVQDLDVVVQQGKATFPRIQYQAHDFFQQQPVKGARAYFLHTVLHDWPDQLAKTILERVKDAMDPEYSKLLVCDSVLPERAQSPRGGATDLVMMGLLSAKERTEAQWRGLLASAGFEHVRIWGSDSVGQSVLEAQLSGPFGDDGPA